MLTVFVDNKEIPVNFTKFSDGAITFKLDEIPPKPSKVCVNVYPSTPVNEVKEELHLIEDCFFNQDDIDLGESSFILNLPYLPYARGDRRFEKGNPYPLLCFMTDIYNQIWDKIHVCDVHNTNSLKGVIAEKFINKPQLDCYKSSLPQGFNTKYDYVVAPDKGAVEKAKTIADYLGIPVVYAEKTRNISIGKIERFSLPEGVILSDKKVLIPDDICDGGGTFVGLSEEQVKDIYTVFFASTKVNDNDTNGCLGLGSKSAYSVCDQFTVTVIKDGIICVYSCYINKEGFPYTDLKSRKDTELGNGVT